MTQLTYFQERFEVNRDKRKNLKQLEKKTIIMEERKIQSIKRLMGIPEVENLAQNSKI